MNYKKTLLVLLAFVSFAAAGWAYSSAARNSLLRSRDQVLDQKAQLERAYTDIDRKIAELQQQKYNAGRYIQDCDRSLRDIDRALNAQESAARDMR